MIWLLLFYVNQVCANFHNPLSMRMSVSVELTSLSCVNLYDVEDVIAGMKSGLFEIWFVGGGC